MAEAMPMCPMANMCRGMMENRFSGYLCIIPGILFIAFGVLIAIEPGLLVWFAAAGAILMGVMMLVMAGFMRSVGRGGGI